MLRKFATSRLTATVTEVADVADKPTWAVEAIVRVLTIKDLHSVLTTTLRDKHRLKILRAKLRTLGE
jgi:hypothetical protein